MWRNVIELENKIKAERIELAKTYAVNNGINPKHMTEDDLFAIYSCLMIKNALETTHKGRDYIIDEVILKAIPEPRADVGKYAPKMISMKINPDKIREVIGKGGEVIQKITAETNTKIDIEEDGSIFILAVNKEDAYVAKGIIDAIVFEPVEGCCYTGTVTRIIPIGAFVEIAPGKEGLVHISKLDTKRVENVEDAVSVGDKITVKFLGMDEKGRINLSRKDALKED